MVSYTPIDVPSFNARLIVIHQGKKIQGVQFDLDGTLMKSFQHRKIPLGNHPVAPYLRDYFEGRKIDFSSLEGDVYPELENPFRPGFSRRVFETLKTIPYGETLTYLELARRIQSSAARAVGNVLRKNPFPVLVPCHRVVAQTGLGGFHGQRHGPFLHVKRFLLRLEGSVP